MQNQLALSLALRFTTDNGRRKMFTRSHGDTRVKLFYLTTALFCRHRKTTAVAFFGGRFSLQVIH